MIEYPEVYSELIKSYERCAPAISMTLEDHYEKMRQALREQRGANALEHGHRMEFESPAGQRAFDEEWPSYSTVLARLLREALDKQTNHVFDAQSH